MLGNTLLCSLKETYMLDNKTRYKNYVLPSCVLVNCKNCLVLGPQPAALSSPSTLPRSFPVPVGKIFQWFKWTFILYYQQLYIVSTLKQRCKIKGMNKLTIERSNTFCGSRLSKIINFCIKTPNKI